MTQRDADWLDEAARYFEKRPTGGEDMAFWANVTNAERCRSIASALRASSGVEVKPAFWAVHSASGMHIGLWNTEEVAKGVLQEYPNGKITALYASPLTTVEVTEEMVERVWKNARGFVSPCERSSIRHILTAALSPNKAETPFGREYGEGVKLSVVVEALSQNKGEE